MQNIHISKIPKGRKISNDVNIHVVTGRMTQNYFDEQRDRQIDQPFHHVIQFPKPSMFVINKNKENIHSNILTKRTLDKVQSSKSISKIKNSTVGSKIQCKKVESNRSSLSKRTKSQTTLMTNKQKQKGKSPKNNTIKSNKQTKPLLSDRELKTTRLKDSQVSKKKNSILTNPKNKKTPIIQSNLILNQQSTGIAKQLQKITKQIQNPKKVNKKPSPIKQYKKVIISQNISKHRLIQQSSPDSPDSNILEHKYKSKKIINQTIWTKSKFSKHHNNSLKTKKQQHNAAITIQRAFRKYKQIQYQKQVNKIVQEIVKIQRWWRKCLKMKHNLQQSSLVLIKKSSYQRQQKQNSIPFIQKQKNNQTIQSQLQYSKTERMYTSPAKKQSYQQLDSSCLSPSSFTNNIYNIQRYHKQKLIKNYNKQKQAVVKLWQQKMCSPKTHQGKLQQLDENFNKQLLRFEAGIKQVVRGMSLTKTNYHESNEDFMLCSPSPNKKVDNQVISQHKSFQNQNNNFFDNKQISQLSIQISYNDTKTIDQKFDSSLQAVKMYLNNLYQYLTSIPFSKQFMLSMNQKRGIPISNFLLALQNLQNENNKFQLPLYKQHQDTNQIVIPKDIIQQFNIRYFEEKINQTNHESYEHIHTKAIVDALNQQLHKQRRLNNLILISPSNVFSKTMQQCLTSAFDGVIQSTTILCGFLDDNNEVDQQYLLSIREQRLKQMLNMSIKEQSQNMNEQTIQVLYEVSNQVMDDILEEVVFQLYKKMHHHY